MIKHLYKIVFFALLIVSCNNNENSGNENNLLEISKKLNSLDPSVIGENNNSQTAEKQRLRVQTLNINSTALKNVDRKSTPI